MTALIGWLAAFATRLPKRMPWGSEGGSAMALSLKKISTINRFFINTANPKQLLNLILFYYYTARMDLSSDMTISRHRHSFHDISNHEYHA